MHIHAYNKWFVATFCDEIFVENAKHYDLRRGTEFKNVKTVQQILKSILNFSK